MKAILTKILPAALLFGTVTSASAVVFTNDTLIGAANPSYDNQTIVVSNGTLTVDGPHTFADVRIATGAVLTHTASSNGSITNYVSVTNESVTLNQQVAVNLAHPNVILATVLVRDISGTITYAATNDYFFSSAFPYTAIIRANGSTIPDGATVLVSYDYSVGTTNTGLNLTINGNLDVESGAAINVDGRGMGGNLGTGNGGEAGSPQSGGGAGYGGIGGASSSNSPGGTYYGSYTQPTDLGSGGGSSYIGIGGPGGGAMRIAVTGQVTNNGIISANGAGGMNSRSGGGSGGSIWITATGFGGNGTFSANGGLGEPIHGGGGAGGRIALEYGGNAFTGAITAFGGNGGQRGAAGTVYTANIGQPGTLTLDNGGFAGAITPMQVTNSAAVTIRGRALGMVTAVQTLQSLTVKLDGTLMEQAYPSSSFALTVSGNATIESGGSFTADILGYPPNSGSGVGRFFTTGNTNFGGGGGHGGYGASYSNITTSAGGNVYDSTTAPSIAGSGGGGSAFYQTNVAGSGGGVIRFIVNGTLTMNGNISANGGSAAVNGGGGGAGGSIYLTVGSITGAGSISVNGGAGNLTTTSGGGGGGRIAIAYNNSSNFTGNATAYGGGGYARGGAGTIFWGGPTGGGVVIMDNNGNLGTNTSITVSSLDVTVKNGAILASPNSTIHNLLIQSNGWLFTTPYPSSPSTFTISGDATIDPAGGIIGDGFGYTSASGPGFGGSQSVSGSPSSVYYGGGGGHGGYGGSGGHSNDRGGNTYDSITAPATFGSSGGGSGSSFAPYGGSGGGAYHITVSGKLTVNGRVSADGANGNGENAGGGAGGSVWLSVGTLAGSGLLSANGGNGTFGGGGGGGRIAITYNSNQFNGSMTAYGGGGTNRGGAGTIYTKTNSANIGQLLIANNSPTTTNTPISGVAADVIVKSFAIASIPTVTSIQSLLVMTNGSLGLTQALTVLANATVQNGGTITADGGGFTGASGPGAGYSFLSGTKGGGGHGGFGAGNPSSSGSAYDSIIAPNTTGSGGGNGSGSAGLSPFGGAGGGFVRLTVNGLLTVDGDISSDGRNGDFNSGGGSGGSVYLTVGGLTGNGIISATGGSGNGIGGGGGGGRMSIGYNSNLFTGTYSVAGGSGNGRGGAGTMYFKQTQAATGLLLVDNGGNAGTNTPLSSAYGLPASPFNLTISGGASLYPLTALPLLSNVTVNAGGTLTLLPPVSNLTVGVLGDFNVAAGGTIASDGRGYARATGPGAGATQASKGAGGGYGGAGGASASLAAGGAAYGSLTLPVDNGSGGGAGGSTYFGGCEGGGYVRLSVGGKLIVNGNLSANGNLGLQDDSGGGAGGSVLLNASQVLGNGTIFAKGGSGDLYGGGGGGGGRIAIYTPSNTFTGLVSVAGGAGATPGQTGTVYTSASLLPFQGISQTPTGAVSNTVSTIDISFSDAVDPNSVTSSDFKLYTPGGQLASFFITPSFPSLTTIRLTVLTENFVGNYRLETGPAIQNLSGQPMTQVYTGAFSIFIPSISGTVRDTNGIGVAGVTVQPSGGLQAAATDGSGAYTFGVPNGWSGTVTPSLGTSVFVPGTRTYSTVLSDTNAQDFLMYSTFYPSLTSSPSGTNFALGWYGITNVTYQPSWSTNLIDWYPLDSPIIGTNGLLQLMVPMASDPVKFFRLNAQY